MIKFLKKIFNGTATKDEKWAYIQTQLKRKITPETIECELDIDFLTKFLPIMQEGDELWYFDNDGWDKLGGRAGYCIVRDRDVVHSEIWAMN